MTVKKQGSENVAVPITPMLDMAFQLLTFFILTYHPMPSEIQFSMNLMPAVKDGPAVPEVKDGPLPAALRTLPTRLLASGNGSLERITLGETEVEGLDGLRRDFTSALSDKDLSFDQTLIEVDPKLKYSELMRVIDVFSEVFAKVKMPAKISFAELGADGTG